MKLTVPERLILVNVLPAESDYTTLKLVRKLRESLSFTEEEHKQLNFRNRYECPVCKAEVYSATMPKCEDKGCGGFGQYMSKDNLVTWNGEAHVVKDIHMGIKAKELIVSTLKKMSDEKKLNETYLDAYEKFVKAIEED